MNRSNGKTVLEKMAQRVEMKPTEIVKKLSEWWYIGVDLLYSVM
jgi:hypothetical protein